MAFVRVRGSGNRRGALAGVSLCALAMGAFATPALAQDTPAASQDTAGTQDNGDDDDIVVNGIRNALQTAQQRK